MLHWPWQPIGNCSVWKDRHEKSELALPAKTQQCLKTAVSTVCSCCIFFQDILTFTQDILYFTLMCYLQGCKNHGSLWQWWIELMVRSQGFLVGLTETGLRNSKLYTFTVELCGQIKGSVLCHSQREHLIGTAPNIGGCSFKCIPVLHGDCKHKAKVVSPCDEVIFKI